MAKDTEIKEKEEINVNNSNEDLLAKITAAQKELDAKAEELNKKILELEEKSKAIDEKTLEIDNKLKEIPDRWWCWRRFCWIAIKDKGFYSPYLFNPSGTIHYKKSGGTINGYRYRIIRGEEVEVPVTVTNILKEAKYL